MCSKINKKALGGGGRRMTKKAVYNAKCDAERNRVADVSRRNDQKSEGFKIVKMVKTNHDFIGEQSRRNGSVLVISNKDKKIN